MKFARRYKEKNKKNTFITLIQFVLIGCMLISAYFIIKWVNENRKTSKISSKIKTAVTVDGNDEYSVNFESLEKENSDVVAWIKVNNTGVEYPVVKTNNNDYYLMHSFDKTQNRAGWIFADYKNKFDGTDKNIIVYGHNRKDGSMFGTLGKVLKPEWYENEQNQEITFITKDQKDKYQIFSIYEIPDEDYYLQTVFSNSQEYIDFLEELKSRSIYNFNVIIDENTQILTLSTCAANLQNRIVIHAKKSN